MRRPDVTSRAGVGRVALGVVVGIGLLLTTVSPVPAVAVGGPTTSAATHRQCTNSDDFKVGSDRIDNLRLERVPSGSLAGRAIVAGRFDVAHSSKPQQVRLRVTVREPSGVIARQVWNYDLPAGVAPQNTIIRHALTRGQTRAVDKAGHRATVVVDVWQQDDSTRPVTSGHRHTVVAKNLCERLMPALPSPSQTPTASWRQTQARAAGSTEHWMLVAQAAASRTVPMSRTSDGHDRFRLVLRAPAPVIKFADRPFRDAALISPKALVTNWATWFAGSAPNAVLTVPREDGQAPDAIVLELTEPAWDRATRSLSFVAVRNPVRHDPVSHGSNWIRPTTPATAVGVSLFIDDLDCPDGEGQDWVTGQCYTG